MNVDAYLARIGLGHRPPATLAGLTQVHRAHMLSIPYENLDVQLGPARHHRAAGDLREDRETAAAAAGATR
ncbi:MAG: hypothetical protein WDM81_09375 [Rhizomicrobium sp.]